MEFFSRRYTEKCIYTERNAKDMVISFIDGTRVSEPGVYDAIRTRLTQLIRPEETITFYFYASTDFLLQCEWIVRKLQAVFPKKTLERVAVAGLDDIPDFVPCRFDRCEMLECVRRTDVWRWMVDHSDYAITYMHAPICPSRDRLTAWHYANKHLQDRCINFATEECWTRMCDQIPSLPKWERKAIELKLRGERQSNIALSLDVSQTTAHSYQTGAGSRLEKAVYTPEPPHRTCAVLGFVNSSISEDFRGQLRSTVSYLIYGCGVTKFIVQNRAYHASTPLMHILYEQKDRFIRKISVSAIELNKNTPTVPAVNPETGRIDRCLDERRAMIDQSDIALCHIQNSYGSGLHYAMQKHVPVINLAAVK